MSKSIFSQIVAGTIPSYKIFEDEYVFAFLARDAIQLGHTLIIPKVEVDYFVDVPEPYYTAIFQSAKPLAQVIHKVTGCKRVGTIIAGWDVPHFHYHLVPMFDYYDLDPKRACQRSHQENAGIQQKIISQLSTIYTCSFRGMIVEESLADPSVINHLSIKGVQITDPGRWHVYTVELTDHQIGGCQNWLKEGPWYMHFWRGDEIIVVFKERIFRFSRHDKSTWTEAIAHGLKLAIPKEQLDFLTEPRV